MDVVIQKGQIRQNLLQHWKLAFILAGYVVLVGLYSWSTPPFEGPDESQHYAYITWLAEGKGFPPQGNAAWETPIQQEAGQSPLYYLLASFPTRLVGAVESPAVFRSNPHFGGPIPRIVPDNDNRAIHYPADAWPFVGGWLALYLARVITLAFGVLLLLSVYGLGLVIFPEVPLISLAATLLIAVNPQVLFISSVVSNDIPAAAFSALTLWLLSILLLKGPTRGVSLALGAAFGLAILTKASAIMLVVPIGAGLAWLWLSRRQSLSQVIKIGVWLTLSMGLICGWWLIRSWLIYGSPLGLETHDLTPWAINDPSSLVKFHQRWYEVFRSFWLAFGWGTIRPQDSLHDTLLILAVVATLGLFIAGWRWLRKPSPKPDKQVAMLVILALTVLAVGFSLELWMQRVVAPYGRLMFPSLAAISVLLATGWYVLHPKLPFVIAVFILALALLAPFLLIRPAYEPPKALSDEAVEQISPKSNMRFGLTPDKPVAELLSAKTLESSVVAGNNVPVEICWLPITQSEQPFSVLVHLIGPDNMLAANRRTYPGLGKFPTTIWEPGHVFCDLVQVRIMKDLERTLLYKVEIALLDLETSKRLNIYDLNDNPVPTLFVDDVRLVTLNPQEPFVTATDAGDSPLQLAGFDLNTTTAWSPGEELYLSLQWGVSKSVNDDYQVFVHLRDQSDGNNVAQADGPPLAGWYPTSHWPAGEIIVDERRFVLPADVPAGTYDLVVGFYDLNSGQQLGSEHFLKSIEVRP
jgi:4-amino-4-deoxy-L-arabinose transferase-like glycosyltransferase